MNEQNQRRADELELDNDRLQKELDRLANKYESDKKELLKQEKENEQLKKTINSTGDQAKLNFQKLRNLEIDNEAYER
jgi:hypothetical protein